MSPGRTRDRPEGAASLVDAEWVVEVGPVAHGGHCVARHEGQVIFVRHALPGERVRVRVTEGRVGDRFVRGDAIEVLEASPHRVPAPCPYAVPGGCGGCDFQHVELGHQRELKAAVVREQLQRLAGLDLPVEVQTVPGDRAGLRWRTRVEFAVDAHGRAGLRPHRSRTVIPLEDCLISTEAVIASGVLDTVWEGVSGVDVIDAAHPDEPVLVPLTGAKGTEGAGGLVGELVRDGDWEAEYVVAARGFWQVHPGAASTFLSRVSALLDPQPGDRVLDLYAGSGLFTRRLGELVLPDGFVLGVEGDATAVENGIRNTEDLENVEWRANRVDREVRSLASQGVTADLVVLDPPRTGAGRDVIETVVALGPRRMVYVACDPAALARDLRTASDQGYAVVALEAYDAFPMTHHVECIAVLEPVDRA
ncbi:MAG TPA: TRAM domain-containing protein [Dermatophilaceae bacterium]|nr:TRAM domain-containing protein [Dermatophilaceae bacterium]